MTEVTALWLTASFALCTQWHVLVSIVWWEVIDPRGFLGESTIQRCYFPRRALSRWPVALPKIKPQQLTTVKKGFVRNIPERWGNVNTCKGGAERKNSRMYLLQVDGS